MAQYKAFAFGAEVSGKMILSLLNAVPGYENKLRTILSKNNIENPDSGKWYNMQDYLNSLKEVFKLFGPNLLFSIGKHIPKANTVVNEAGDLELALRNLDLMYQENHRGEIGYYKLVSFSSERKEAKLECKNPYPCYVDRGILTMLSRRFKPKEANLINVELDNHCPSRLAGNDVSYYTIVWL